MKTKIFEKKLVLNRKTIVNLDARNMQGAQAGKIMTWDIDCWDIIPYCRNSDRNSSCYPTNCIDPCT